MFGIFLRKNLHKTVSYLSRNRSTLNCSFHLFRSSFIETLKHRYIETSKHHSIKTIKTHIWKRKCYNKWKNASENEQIWSMSWCIQCLLPDELKHLFYFVPCRWNAFLLMIARGLTCTYRNKSRLIRFVSKSQLIVLT